MRHPKGLTLIELTATVAITGMLVAAALSVATRLSRADAISNRRHEKSVSRSSLENLLATDIIHAVQYRNASNGAEMRLRSRLDAGSLELEHLRSTVRFEVRQIAGRWWLLRIQKTPDRPDLIELVLPGVSAVSLKPAKADVAVASDDWQEMPEVVVFKVEFAEGGRGPVVLTFSTRQ
jgi:prepilin-type N-terminal cleavage/methylation domain-containing protein